MGPEGSENKGDKVVLKAKLIFMFAIRIYHIICKTFLIVQTVVGQIHEIGKIIKCLKFPIYKNYVDIKEALALCRNLVGLER